MRNRKTYYRKLGEASRGDMDVTRWVRWFVETVYEAQMEAKQQIQHVLAKAKFWDSHQSTALNPRQRKVINRLFEAEPKGFAEGISADKYKNITRSSKATATRDLADLVEKGCLVKLDKGGRSTRYALRLS
jgi:Fic family protein